MAVTYAAVQLPMIAGLKRAHAKAHHYLVSPLVAVPLMAVSAAGIALSGSGLAALGIASHSALQLIAGAGLGAMLGYAGGKSIAQGASHPVTYRRGAKVDEHATEMEPQKSGRRRDHGITLAGARVPIHDEAKHFKFIGTTGTGKSTAIQEILSKALDRGDRAVIADPDGGYMDRFYKQQRGDIVLNPFDERSVKWDLFAEIKNAYDVEQLARSLIPDHEGQDRSWRGYARTFFSAVARQAHEAGIRDVEELYRLLVVADSQELRGLVRGTPAQPFLDEHNSRMFDSIRSVASSAVGALEYVGRQKTKDFSVRRWVADSEQGILFMPYKAGQIAALRSTISAWMRLAIFEAMDQRTPRQDEPQASESRLWFVVDELDALGQIDGLKDALARLRKFGGRCVLGFQSLAQVSSTYGPGDAHTIVENCGNTLILRCSASEGGGTARFASQLIGEREVIHTAVSNSRRTTQLFGSVTHSQHLSVEPAVLPAQIEQLPDLAGYLKFASDPHWRRIRLDAQHIWQQRRSETHHGDGNPKARERECRTRE